MSLSKLFASKSTTFRNALKTNDVAALRGFIGKKADGIEVSRAPGKNPSLSKEVVQLLLTEMTDEDWSLWWPWPRTRPDCPPAERKRVLLSAMAESALEAKRFDLVEMLLDKKLGFNCGAAQEHFIGRLIEADLPDDRKGEALRKALAEGYGKIENAQSFLSCAADRNFLQGIDLLAAAGFDIHAQNEMLLRNAAQPGREDLCRHLVDAHRADVDLAVRTARKLGNEPSATWLEQLFPAPDDRPRTVESLTAEVRDLRAAVQELTAIINEMRLPEKRLDKPVLPAPVAPAPKGTAS